VRLLFGVYPLLPNICQFRSNAFMSTNVFIAADTRFTEPLSSSGLIRLSGVMSQYACIKTKFRNSFTCRPVDLNHGKYRTWNLMEKSTTQDQTRKLLLVPCRMTFRGVSSRSCYITLAKALNICRFLSTAQVQQEYYSLLASFSKIFSTGPFFINGVSTILLSTAVQFHANDAWFRLVCFRSWVITVQ
jgi:hypothetical protein